MCTTMSYTQDRSYGFGHYKNGNYLSNENTYLEFSLGINDSIIPISMGKEPISTYRYKWYLLIPKLSLDSLDNVSFYIKWHQKTIVLDANQFFRRRYIDEHSNIIMIHRFSSGRQYLKFKNRKRNSYDLDQSLTRKLFYQYVAYEYSHIGERITYYPMTILSID